MLQHKTGPEMHREVRAILTSVGELSFKASRGKTRTRLLWEFGLPVA